MVEIEKVLPWYREEDEVVFCSENRELLSEWACSSRYVSQPVEGFSPNTVSKSLPGHVSCVHMKQEYDNEADIA